MHDWTLVSILFEWRAARATLSFLRPGGAAAAIVADGVSRLDVPRRNEWGPSVSVNRVVGPTKVEGSVGQTWRVTIEMQSGDVIEVLAASFALPNFGRKVTALAANAAAGE